MNVYIYAKYLTESFNGNISIKSKLMKTENYIKYMLNIIMKLPRTEKFNIGNEYKNMMYIMLEDVMMLGKIGMEEKLDYINKIDARINVQRVFLRIMKDNRWIDEKKFSYSMSLLDELGRIVGGLLKAYAQNIKK